MELSDHYEHIQKAIVAFVPMYLPLIGENAKPPAFPPIIGTGFVVNSRGLIVTNDHVIKAIKSLPIPPGIKQDHIPAEMYMFRYSEAGAMTLTLKCEGLFEITQYDPGENYLGPPIPDIGFVTTNVCDLPVIKLESSLRIREGMEVATAGYPMGTDALMAPGWLHQLSPTLQKGIVSAVLPFPCENPHSFSIDVMTQGGASGSPVFDVRTGNVIGVLYGGLQDAVSLPELQSIPTPTNISYVVPYKFITRLLDTVMNGPEIGDIAGNIPLSEYIDRSEKVKHDPRDFGFERVSFQGPINLERQLKK